MENKKSDVDAMTHGMLSASLLVSFMKAVYSDKRDTMTVGELYDAFNKTHHSEKFVPFNEGVILAFLYWLVFASENWKDVMPTGPLSNWNITPKRLVAPEGPAAPPLEYLVRRMRNAMVHKAPKITVPKGTTLEMMETAVTITFTDVDQRNKQDTFNLELTLKDAMHLTKTLHKIVLTTEGKRHGVKAPKAAAKRR